MTREKKPSGRPDSTFQRRAKSKRNPLILIICQGSQTEPRYFRALRAGVRTRLVRIEVVPASKGKSAPGKLLEVARRKAAEWDVKRSRDQVWCVFDTEQPGQWGDLNSIAQQAKKAGVELAISNPAIEYWFLLHFKATNRLFKDASDAIAALRQCIPGYEKNRAIYRGCLDVKTQDALANACLFRNGDAEHWDNWRNPSTGVDRLVRAIIESAERRSHSDD
jgi:hypothetical protein